jgi:hypothetical protein
LMRTGTSVQSRLTRVETASLTNFSKVARVNVANDAGDDVAFSLNSADDGDFLLQLASAADRPHQCPFGSGCTQPSASA